MDFVELDRDLVGVVAEHGLDRNGLEFVSILGRSAVGVDVAQLRRRDPRVLTAMAMHRAAPSPLGAGDVI